MNMREKIAERIRLHTTDAKWTPEGLADAVLDALTEPTEGMLENEDEVSLSAWKDMIRAAKEGK